MGQGCMKKISEPATEPEKPIIINSYASSADEVLSSVENKYNLLKYLDLSEYLLLISTFQCEPIAGIDGNEEDFTSQTDKSYLLYLSKTFFQIFIENKILKHFLLYETLGEEEGKQRIFKEVVLFVYTSLLLKLNNITHKKMEHLKKLHLIALGFLYCRASTAVKMMFIYNLFVDDNAYFSQSDELDEFVLSIILVSSYCMLYARNKIGDLNEPKISAMSNEMKFALMDSMEEKDAVRLKEIFMKDFFKGKKALTFNEFEENFETRDFGWLLSSIGLRCYLEKFNDKQAQ